MSVNQELASISKSIGSNQQERDSESISRDLKAPFKDVKQRQGPGGKMLSYITARQVMDRLDSVVGPDGWQVKYHTVAGHACCELSVNYCGIWITKSDGAGETSIEGEKGSFSDALKRAAVHHGIARYLYPDAEQPRTNSTGRQPESVAVTAARESGAPMTKALKYAVDEIVQAVFKDDPFRFYEIWDEFDNDEKTTIFGDLPSAERKQVRDWQKNRSAE